MFRVIITSQNISVKISNKWKTRVILKRNEAFMRGICYEISRVKIGAEFKKTSNQDCLVKIFNFNSIF